MQTFPDGGTRYINLHSLSQELDPIFNNDYAEIKDGIGVTKMSNYLFFQTNYVSRSPDAKISDYITVKNLFKRGFLREDIPEFTFYRMADRWR